MRRVLLATAVVVTLIAPVASRSDTITIEPSAYENGNTFSQLKAEAGDAAFQSHDNRFLDPSTVGRIMRHSQRGASHEFHGVVFPGSEGFPPAEPRSTQHVPEPSGLPGLVMGLGGILYLRRRIALSGPGTE
jgi:hypothetical protein